MPARTHPMQRLLPDVPVTGPVPERDPEYGIVYTIVDAVSFDVDEIREEVEFDSISTSSDGYVHLTLRGRPVARAAMTGPHADDRLIILDPVPEANR